MSFDTSPLPIFLEIDRKSPLSSLLETSYISYHAACLTDTSSLFLGLVGFPAL